MKEERLNKFRDLAKVSDCRYVLFMLGWVFSARFCLAIPQKFYIYLFLDGFVKTKVNRKIALLLDENEIEFHSVWKLMQSDFERNMSNL